ncbi:MAG: ABC transporter permease [Myxococcota bacterium]|nr:ABC transporter permease [Myxococcota bacterium]
MRSRENSHRPSPPNVLQGFTLLGTLYLRRSVFRSRSVLLLVLVATNATLASLTTTTLNPDAFATHMFEVFWGFVLPATSLLLGVGVVRDELEAGTIGYLLLRPIPRSVVYSARVFSACGIAIVLAVINTMAVVTVLPIPAEITVGLLIALASAGAIVFTALFAAIGTVFSRPFLVGLGWLIGCERVIASVAFDGRYGAISAHLVGLAGLNTPTDAGLGLTVLEPPSMFGSLSYLAIVFVLALGVGITIFQRRQYVGDAPSD